jgi:hypothetical protein
MKSTAESSVSSAVARRGDSGDQAGYVDEIAAVRHRDHQLITAVRTQEATLKLIAWNVGGTGAITRTGDSGEQAGHATYIDIASHISGTRLVTSCADSGGSLKLISWDASDDGSVITRLGDSGSQAGTARETSIIAVSQDRLVTAVRTEEGDLKLIGWRLNVSDGSLTRLADSGDQAGSVGEIALSLMTDGTVVTSVRDSTGSLKLISWAVSDTAITRLSDSGSLAGPLAATRIRAVVDPMGHLVTAVQMAGNLKLIVWRVDNSGQFTRLTDSGEHAGETVGHDISLAAGRIITGVRTKGSALKVIMWQTASEGTVTRIGDSASQAGSIDFVVQCEELTAGPPIVTCVKTSFAENLKLISWSPAA